MKKKLLPKKGNPGTVLDTKVNDKMVEGNTIEFLNLKVPSKLILDQTETFL